MTWATSELVRSHAAPDVFGWPDDRTERGTRVPFADAVARMTHDIRTPLNAVIGFAALMQRELHGALGSDRYREYVGHIAECGTRLLSATEQALLLAATATGPTPCRAGPVALQEVVALALDLIATRPERAGGIETEIELDLTVTVDCDATRFAISNLIAAARRQGPPGSTIRLASRVDCGMLALEITACGQPLAPARAGSSDGHVAIARRLLEMQGLELVTGGRAGEAWLARIVFTDTAQLQLL